MSRILAASSRLPAMILLPRCDLKVSSIAHRSITSLRRFKTFWTFVNENSSSWQQPAPFFPLPRSHSPLHLPVLPQRPKQPIIYLRFPLHHFLASKAAPALCKNCDPIIFGCKTVRLDEENGKYGLFDLGHTHLRRHKMVSQFGKRRPKGRMSR
jgi:hypothetical protein